MWQLGINTKFHQESRSFIFRPRLLLQRAAEYSNDIDCSSHGIDCLKPASRIRGCRTLVFQKKMKHAVVHPAIRYMQLQSKPWKFKPQNSLVLVMKALSLATDPHGMLGHERQWLNMCTEVHINLWISRIQQPVRITPFLPKDPYPSPNFVGLMVEKFQYPQ